MHLYTQYVTAGIAVGLTFGINPPLAVFAVKYDLPCFLPWYRPQRIFSCFEALSLDSQILICFKNSGFICARSPHLAIGNQGSKYFAALFIRSVIKYFNSKITFFENHFALRTERLR